MSAMADWDPYNPFSGFLDDFTRQGETHRYQVSMHSGQLHSSPDLRRARGPEPSRQAHVYNGGPPVAEAARKISMETQFSQALQEEHARHQYRYITINALTKSKDAKRADTHNNKIYDSAMRAQRQKSLHATYVVGGDATLPPPPKPTNAERYKIYKENQKKVAAAEQAIAVYNLSLYGQVPFVHYQPIRAAQAWRALQWRLAGHFDGPNSSNPRAYSAPIPITQLGQLAYEPQTNSAPGSSSAPIANYPHVPQFPESPESSGHGRSVRPPPQAPAEYLKGRSPAGRVSEIAQTFDKK